MPTEFNHPEQSGPYRKLLESLRDLGIAEGDVVLLKGDLTEIGFIDKTPKGSRDLIFKVLWDAVGGKTMAR